MSRELSVATRDELVRALSKRYGSESKKGKARILDEFVAVTGFHRKHAVRVLNTTELVGPARRRGRACPLCQCG